MTTDFGPGESQDGGLLRRSLLGGGAAMALLGLLPAAQAATANGLQLHAAGPRTRLSFALRGRAAWRLSAQNNPPRLVLDLPATEWEGGPPQAGATGLVAGIRYHRTARGGQLVIALAGPVAAPRARLQDGRLVIELHPGTAAGFARLADGRQLAGTAAPTAGLPLVVLDPGHGGRDPGTIGGRGTHEKRITLAAALELKRQLEAGGRCRVALTRSRDVFVPLGDRIALARRREAALFLSLHADSAPGARGASVYTLSETASDTMSAALARRENLADQAGGLRLPSVSPEVSRILLSLMRQEVQAGSERIARLTVNALEGEVPLLPHTHRRAGFVVLKAPDVPAALVEMGFLSHPADEAALLQPGHRQKIARALVEAVHGFLGRGDQVAAG